MGQTLTIEQKLEHFCYCLYKSEQDAGCTIRPEDGRPVHWACGKPKPFLGIRICEDCGIEFINFDVPRFKVWPNGKVTLNITYCDDCL